jgi:aminoglycoside phosphotransferase (APT) family kinase protein
MAHEGEMLARLAGGAVPRLLAHEDGRILMPEIPGEDLYDAERPALEQMVDLLVGLQRAWTGRVGELLAIGLPDWREPALTAAIADAIERTPEVASDDRSLLDEFTAALPDRFRRLREAGIPDTLVHGDFHPGNARGDGTTIVLLDWGDCGVGHPLLDQPAFLDRIPPAAVDPIRSAWNAAWRAAIPGSDPARAAMLLAPVAAARQAVIYRTFLDRIEPAEHPYHAADPADWLRRTADLLREPSTVR